ncbi:ubiquinone biosynthesis O-methyltransferase, mitochondrial isoform X2 [Lucilia sericata]|uniref:ubiquinone biosynthesis O-methyltransferase, mitochondrial isoform X2 n=1 Tax=Lucilia sericata TaxID=13632 RepID=UPI0018A839D4|nr:ubiquinone biosynthesis O-methyltransferase, mitochondrial isoform X2 [Lucilia sericata]
MSQQIFKTIAGVIKQQRRQILVCTNNHVQYLTKLQHSEAGQHVAKTQPLTDLQTSNQQKFDNETQREVQHHGNYANDWWNLNGTMKALHSLNAIRVPFIRDGLVARGNISPELVNTCQVLKDQQILEVGCGGGILTEQLARLGAQMTGIDLSDELIRVAREHLSHVADPKLCDNIQYKIEPLDIHVKDKMNYYDAVVVSEVLEHVEDKVALLTSCVQSLKPGGSLFITTLNKTIPMWLGGVLLGEYILKIAPVGTHHWDKMISPLDVQRILDTMGCHTVIVNGSTYEFWSNTWRWINSTDMFYALQAVKTEI